MGKQEQSCYYTAYILFDTYYNVNKPQWRDINNIAFLDKVEYRAYKFYIKYQKLWSSCSQKMLSDLSQKLREKAIKDGMLLEELTMKDWLNKIMVNYKDKI